MLANATDLDPDLVKLRHLVWLNSKEAARYLRKTENALRIMVHRGYLAPSKFRSRLYFRREQLDRLLESSLPTNAVEDPCL